MNKAENDIPSWRTRWNFLLKLQTGQVEAKLRSRWYEFIRCMALHKLWRSNSAYTVKGVENYSRYSIQPKEKNLVWHQNTNQDASVKISHHNVRKKCTGWRKLHTSTATYLRRCRLEQYSRKRSNYTTTLHVHGIRRLDTTHSRNEDEPTNVQWIALYDWYQPPKTPTKSLCESCYRYYERLSRCLPPAGGGKKWTPTKAGLHARPKIHGGQNEQQSGNIIHSSRVE